MKTSKIKPPFKTLNSKYHACEWIIEHLPEGHETMVYLEPFCGSASVLINKPLSSEEAISDLDQGIVKIMKTVRDECDDFVNSLQRIRLAQDTFDKALECKEFHDDLDEAVNEFILRKMSKNGQKEAFDKKNDQKSWETSIKVLPKIAQRIERVYIFDKPAATVLNAFNKPNTLAYIDPPALEEETEIQHAKLAEMLRNFKGKVLVSGHPSSIYNRLYKSWRCEKKKPVPKTGKQECLWLNY